MAIITFPDLTITSLETITAYDLAGDFRFMLDELQDATIAHTQETTDITGKGGRRLSSLKRNKAVTVSGTNGLISGGLLEAQVGSRFTEGATNVLWTDYLTVNDNAATTTWKAVGTAGNEISQVLVKENGVVVKELTQNAEAGADKFSYAPETKIITFNAGDIDNGTEIVVRYQRNIEGHVLFNMSDSYSEKLALYIDAFGEDKCGNTYRVQFYIPKADFNGEFELAMGDSQLVHAFEAQSLAGACGLSGDMLWTFTVFGTAAADAT